MYSDRNDNGLIGSLILPMVVILMLSGIVWASIKVGWYAGAIIACVPAILFCILKLLGNPFWLFIALFITNYLIMGVVRYIPTMPGGIVMDGIYAICLLTTLWHFKQYATQQTRLNNVLTWSVSIWLLYCLLELLNPEAVSLMAWLTGVRGIVTYFFFSIILIQLLVTTKQHVRILIFTWSILVLLAVSKAFVQKYIGFDDAEKRWLFVDGFARTHIINTGIRYFSFFTDAANFGTGMAYSFVVFLVVALNEEKRKMKLYYMAVTVIALYGMMISGTRTAIIIPAVAAIGYVLINRNYKLSILMIILVVAIFGFFKYTSILNGNQTIRRMRSGFNAQNDASFQVRLSNQNKMKSYMADKYFGVGIGLGGGKAKRYAPDAYMSQIPTDSWLVMIWVETGIVGLIIHLITLAAIMIYGAYILLYRIRDPQLKKITTGFWCGILGMIAASYGNEVFGQLPNNLTIFLGLALIYTAPYLKENNNVPATLTRSLNTNLPHEYKSATGISDHRKL